MFRGKSLAIRKQIKLKGIREVMDEAFSTNVTYFFFKFYFQVEGEVNGCGEKRERGETVKW